MTGTARFLLIEENFNVNIGHAEAVTVIEREIRALEGERPKQRRGASAAS
jgi:hypothetical protein